MWTRAMGGALLTLALLGPAPALQADGVAADATNAWQRTLAKHGHRGGLDYAALQKDRADLDTFLAGVKTAQPAAMSKNEQLAFYSNVYNAVTAHFVLERYPGVKSVKDVSGFFDKLTFPVGGENLTLDAIEGRARKLDPRVHFTVVCASTSCPDLRPEAYVAERIEAMLEEQTRKFLSDPSKGLRYDEAKNEVFLSSIFKWYAGDFTGGSTAAAFFARGGILDWVINHAPEPTKSKLAAKRPGVSYLDYDWSLNDRPAR